MVSLRAVAVVAAFLMAATPVVAQENNDEFPGCGGLKLVFRNPDLRPAGDGFVHAGGQMFIQFQAIGAQADQIETFGFSFGPDSGEYDESICDNPVWFTGPYVINYRADRDPSDGFFIPLKTDLVPDGTYAAAVHAYDGANNELARFWARAVVKNCDGTAPGTRCTDDLGQSRKYDNVQPWPIILPGDGVAMEGRHLSIEFAEELSSVQLFINGRDETANMTAWEGRVWDADTVPDYGPEGVGEALAEPCTLPEPAHQCIKYGPAYEWNVRPLTSEDVVRVVAVDMNNNTARKDIHIGAGESGGAVTSDLPNLDITVDSLAQTATSSQSALFKFEMTNTGGGTAHPFTEAEAPEGWETRWLPHSAVEPGQTKKQELIVQPPADTAFGDYQVNASIVYQSGGKEVKRSYELQVTFEGQTKISKPAPGEDGEISGDDEEEAPIGSTGFVIVALLGAALVVMRRNQSRKN